MAAHSWAKDAHKNQMAILGYDAFSTSFAAGQRPMKMKYTYI